MPSPPPPPQYPAPHLVDHPIDLHRDDEVSIVHWLCGGERVAGVGAKPTETALLGQGKPPQHPPAGGCQAGPTLKELCTRVSSRSMTTQILSESWALASGSRYWTGVCCGDGRGWLGLLCHTHHFYYTGLPSPSPLPGSHRDMGRDHPLPYFASVKSGAWGRTPGSLGLTSPHGKPRQRTASIYDGEIQNSRG